MISEKRIACRIYHLKERIKGYSCSDKDIQEILDQFHNECQLVEARRVKVVANLNRALSSSFRLTDENEEDDLVESECESDDLDDIELSQNFVQHSSPRLPSRNVSRIVPIFKWGVQFNGSGELMVFLERVEEMREARGVSKETLFKSAIDLFSEKALSWYRSVRSEVVSWDSLVGLLKRDFIHPDHDDMLLDKIKARKQERGEDVCIYISVMKNLFARMCESPSEEFKLKIIKRNLLNHFISRLSLNDVGSIAELSTMCKKIENSFPHRSLNTQKVFAMSTERTCWNCHKKGHNFNTCKEPLRKFCYRCGNRGHIAPSCPKNAK